MVEAPTAETAAPAQRLRLRQGALISAGSALVLLVVMFASMVMSYSLLLFNYTASVVFTSSLAAHAANQSAG